MAKTLIDVDDDLLRQAKDLLATETKKATVNAALAEVVALHARRALLTDAAEGAFASAEDQRAAAWRR
ncbi:MAG: type II toxin-antitoxin system VapB family antitoxin [Nocardioidaceae bacterium]